MPGTGSATSAPCEGQSRAGFSLTSSCEGVDGEVDAFVLGVVILQVVESLDFPGRVHQVAGERDRAAVDFGDQRDRARGVAGRGLHEEGVAVPTEGLVVAQDGARRERCASAKRNRS